MLMIAGGAARLRATFFTPVIIVNYLTTLPRKNLN